MKDEAQTLIVDCGEIAGGAEPMFHYLRAMVVSGDDQNTINTNPSKLRHMPRNPRSARLIDETAARPAEPSKLILKHGARSAGTSALGNSAKTKHRSLLLSRRFTMW
jgi:hypothetical protein